MVWQMFSLEKSFRQYMFPNPDLSEAERNQQASYQNQIKAWFGHIAYNTCRREYESGRKLKRNLLWKSQKQADREIQIKKMKKRKLEKRLARLQTLHWLIEQQFIEGGVTLSSQLNTSSATCTNLVRLAVALNCIFTHKKTDEKYSMADLLLRLSQQLKELPSGSPTYKSAETLYRKLQSEFQSITQKASEYNKTVKNATVLDKSGWNVHEDFDPDVV